MTFEAVTIELLAQHGLLSGSELCQLADGPAASWCRRALAQMRTNNIIGSVRLGFGSSMAWFLTDQGARMCDGDPMRMDEIIARGPKSAHLRLVNRFGVAAHAAFRGDGAGEVGWEHELALPLGTGRYLRPDALMSINVSTDTAIVGRQWFVEADRGTEATSRLVDKLAAYVEYLEYRPGAPGVKDVAAHWKHRFRAFPGVLFVFDCDRPNHRIARLSAWAQDDPRLRPHWRNLRVEAISVDQLASPADLATKPIAISIPTQTPAVLLERPDAA